MISVLTSLLLSTGLAAQVPPGTAIQAGQTYGGGARVSAPAAGVSFQIPAGHQGAYDPEAEAFLVGSATHPNRILAVFAYSEGTLDEVGEVVLEALAAQGIRLQPRGEPRMDGTSVQAAFDAWTSSGQGVLLATLRAGPPGNVLAAVAFGPPPDEAGMREVLQALTGGAQFAVPLAHRWRAELAGTRLTKARGASSYSPGGVGDGSFASNTETTIDFCRDGSYALVETSESYLSVEGAGSMSSTSEDGHRGRWRLVGDVAGGAHLILQATDGQEFMWKAEEGQGTLILDGAPFSFQASPACY